MKVLVSSIEPSQPSPPFMDISTSLPSVPVATSPKSIPSYAAASDSISNASSYKPTNLCSIVSLEPAAVTLKSEPSFFARASRTLPATIVAVSPPFIATNTWLSASALSDSGSWPIALSISSLKVMLIEPAPRS